MLTGYPLGHGRGKAGHVTCPCLKSSVTPHRLQDIKQSGRCRCQEVTGPLHTHTHTHTHRHNPSLTAGADSPTKCDPIASWLNVHVHKYIDSSQRYEDRTKITVTFAAGNKTLVAFWWIPVKWLLFLPVMVPRKLGGAGGGTSWEEGSSYCRSSESPEPGEFKQQRGIDFPFKFVPSFLKALRVLGWFSFIPRHSVSHQRFMVGLLCARPSLM